MFSLGRYKIGAFKTSSSPQISDLLPWLLVLDDKRTVLLKDGSFMVTWRVRGPDMDSAPDYDFNHVCMRLSAELSRLQGGWTVFFEDARVPSSDYPVGRIENPVADLIDQERREQFVQVPHYENQYYLTVTYLPPSETHNKLRRFFIETGGNTTESDDKNDTLSDFRQKILSLDEAFKRQFIECSPLVGDDILTYLHSTISTSRFKIGSELPIFLDRLLPDEEITGGFNPQLGEKHLRLVGIRQLLGPTKAGLFEELNSLPYEYRMVTRFICQDDSTAQKEIGKLRRFWGTKRHSVASTLYTSITNQPTRVDPEAERRVQDAEDTELELQEGRASFGYLTASIAIMHEDPVVADKRAVELAELIRRARTVPIIEKSNAFEAWLAMVPGNSVANVRRPLLSTIHTAHVMPVSSIWAGPHGVSHESLSGPPHMMAETNSTTPFRVSTYIDDVGHFLVIGPTGAGKSTLLNLLAAQWLRYSNKAGSAQIYAIEAGGSMQCLFKALGGAYHHLEDDTASLEMQPLRDIDEQAEKEWASEWVCRMFENAGILLNPVQRSEVWTAIEAVANQPKKHRNITVLRQALQDEELRVALTQFTVDGAAGRFLDAAISTEPSNIEAIDLGTLLSASYAPIVLDALFHRFERRFNGRPTLLLIDEAWLSMMNSSFIDRLRSWLKMLRKRNVAVGLATQEVSDFLSSDLALTLLQACPAQFFLPNTAIANTKVRKSYESLGLNPVQLDIIEHAQPKSDYYFVSPQGARLVRFSMGPIAGAFCAATSKADQNEMASMDSADSGLAFAAKWLELKGLQEAGAVLRELSDEAFQ